MKNKAKAICTKCREEFYDQDELSIIQISIDESIQVCPNCNTDEFIIDYYGYSVFAISHIDGTQTIKSGLSIWEAIAMVQNLRYQLKKNCFINKTDLDEISDFSFDRL